MPLYWRCLEYGSPRDLRLQTAPTGTLAADQARVAVHAIGVNFLDLAMIGGMADLAPQPPFTPGVEAAGVVTAVGAQAVGVAAGDPVFAFAADGAYAESLDVASDRLVKLPPGFDFTAAAATGIGFGTSWYALRRRAGLAKGETIAILGATGATGLAAVSCAASLGATVIAVGGSAIKLDLARAAGAQALINYREERMADRVREITKGRGVDVIFDTVAGSLLEQALDSLRDGGKTIAVGATSGSAAVLDHMTIVVRNIDAIGISFGAFRQANPELWRQDMTELFQRLHRGDFHVPPFRVYDFSDAPRSLLDLQARTLAGKAVVRVP